MVFIELTLPTGTLTNSSALISYVTQFNIQCANISISVATVGGFQKVISLHPYLSDIEYAKNYTKMAESAKTLAGQQVTAQYFAWLQLLNHKRVAKGHCISIV